METGGCESTRQTRCCLDNGVGVSKWHFTRPRTMEIALVNLLLCKVHNAQLWASEVVSMFFKDVL